MTDSDKNMYRSGNRIMIQLKFERDNLKYDLNEVNTKITRRMRELKNCEDEYIRNKWDMYCKEADYDFTDETRKDLFKKIKNESDKWENIINNGNIMELDGITMDMFNIMSRACIKIKSLIRKRNRITDLIIKTEKQIVLLAEYEDIYSTSI